MMNMFLTFDHVSFAYEGAVSSLFKDVNAHFPIGWTGIAGPNGAGKTTLLHLAAGNLEALQGSIKRPGFAVFCPQRTDNAPDQFADFMESMDSDAFMLRGRLEIGDDWISRWQTLSHGERKRSQIAVALWQQPDILLIDEPTNHIDITARKMLMDALVSFRGIGLLVSHDRELLDLLCRQCLFIDPPEVTMRSGNYTEASTEAMREETSRNAKRKVLEQKLDKLQGESKRRNAKASTANKRRSKRNIAKGDSDGRAKMNLVRVSGKDGQDGRLANQLKGRIAKAKEDVSAIKFKKRYKINFWLDGSVSPRSHLINIPEETIDLDGSRHLIIPSFTMARDDRIAITGANGLGKSTFIRHIMNQLDLPEEHFVYLPQEIDLAQTRNIMKEVQKLSKEQLGIVMTVVSALGTRPERLLKNIEASPGELRKVLLALGVIRKPYLIIMDEPTNHLDLPAIESLENALESCPCGLLLVSHDYRFLHRIANTRFNLEQKDSTVIMSLDTDFGA